MTHTIHITKQDFLDGDYTKRCALTIALERIFPIDEQGARFINVTSDSFRLGHWMIKGSIDRKFSSCKVIDDGSLPVLNGLYPSDKDYLEEALITFGTQYDGTKPQDLTFTFETV